MRRHARDAFAVHGESDDVANAFDAAADLGIHDNEKHFRIGRSARRVVVLAITATIFMLAFVWIIWGNPSSANDSISNVPPVFNTELPSVEPAVKGSPDAASATFMTKARSSGDSPDDEEASMNAILDDLLELHRKDVANREESTLPPLDVPVSYSDEFIVVSMADGGYAACVTRLVETVRGPGRWGGAVTVLVPTGEGTLPLPHTAEIRLRELNADLFPVAPEAAGGASVRGAGSATQYGKVVLLTDESFRRYKSILFLDADGMVGAPLLPLLTLHLPEGRSVAMPTWPSVQAPKETFYAREIAIKSLSSDNLARLKVDCPDRLLVGITAWFLLKPDRMPPPSTMRSEVDSALEKWRPSFRFNDQGLWNVIFYNVSAFYPLCLSGPEPSSANQEFHPLLVDNLDNLALAIDEGCGPSQKKRRPMYAHPLKDCVPDEEWERKKKANRDIPNTQRQDIFDAFDSAQKLGRR